MSWALAKCWLMGTLGGNWLWGARLAGVTCLEALHAVMGWAGLNWRAKAQAGLPTLTS